MTLVSLQPTKPIFVLRHLLPVPINSTFDKSVNFWIYQHPLPVSPIHPKSCAQSISRKALYFLHTFWASTKSVVSESMEKRPSVTTRIAFYVSLSLVFLMASTIASKLRCGNFITFLVAAYAPYCRQLWDKLSMIT